MYAKVGSTILSASAVGTGFLRQEPRGIRSETRCQGQATGAANILLKTPTCSTSVPVLRLLPANNQPSRQAFKFLSRCHLMGDGTEFGSLALAICGHVKKRINGWEICLSWSLVCKKAFVLHPTQTDHLIWTAEFIVLYYPSNISEIGSHITHSFHYCVPFVHRSI